MHVTGRSSMGGQNRRLIANWQALAFGMVTQSSIGRSQDLWIGVFRATSVPVCSAPPRDGDVGGSFVQFNFVEHGTARLPRPNSTTKLHLTSEDNQSVATYPSVGWFVTRPKPYWT